MYKICKVKICTQCNTKKKIKEFHCDISKKDGHRSICKKCKKEIDKNYYQKNIIRCNKRTKNYHQRNIIKIKKIKQKYYQENKNKLNSERRKYHQVNKQKSNCKSRIYYYTNKEECNKRMNKYYQENKQEILARNKQYYLKNKDKIYKKSQEYVKQRMKKDAKFKLRKRFSSLVGNKLRRRLSGKENQSTFTFLSYTIEKLMQRLECQFKPGMTWENYGKWHIDHKKADYYFNYKLIEDRTFQDCWALSNLQPLWALENLRKNKYRI